MDRGKRKVEPEPNKKERRQIWLRRSTAMAAEQFLPLIGHVQQRALQQDASHAKDGVSHVPISEEFVAILKNIMRRLERFEEASGSGQASRNRSGSGQAADPMHEVTPAGGNPEVPSTNPTLGAPVAEPKLEASPP